MLCSIDYNQYFSLHTFKKKSRNRLYNFLLESGIPKNLIRMSENRVSDQFILQILFNLKTFLMIKFFEKYTSLKKVSMNICNFKSGVTTFSLKGCKLN